MRARLSIVLLVLSACRAAEETEHARSMGSARGSASSLRRTAPSARATEIAVALARLRSDEATLRKATDFEAAPPSSRSLGANPYALVELPRGAGSGEDASARYAAILRGDSRVSLRAADFSETHSLPAPRSPSALALAPGGTLFVAGPLEPRIARYALRDGEARELAGIPLSDASVPRALAADPQALVLADFSGDALGALRLGEAESAAPPRMHIDLPTCRGPFDVSLTPRFVTVLCLFDHALALFERDAVGLPIREVARVTHDGPLWADAVLESGKGVLALLGGVENRPLERKDKVFGYVDSFLYLYRLEPHRTPELLLALNVSELGVITPKVVGLELGDGALHASALGYGSDRQVEIDVDPERPSTPRVRVTAGLPGCADALLRDGTRVCANPLFDAFVELRDPPVIHPARPRVPGDPAAGEKLGEALFFTSLMAPDASSEGRLSRFTCETCHFEGGTDGRVHHSGRGDVRVSTRPLFGLLSDAPYFSRAHDRDLTAVCHNEFRVANRGNPVDPWFSVPTTRFPWLSSLGIGEREVPPLELRRSLLEFLARLTHEENPWAARAREPRTFTETEARGAMAFQNRCVGCHAARLVASDPVTEVPFERWQALVLSPEGPIVWARGDYARTGVLPYVDPKGTRIPSLRRLYLKRPYLTRGIARSLEDLLSLVRFSSHELLHAGGEDRSDLAPLGPEEQVSLVAFLKLL